jgi:hypothetical protein
MLGKKKKQGKKKISTRKWLLPFCVVMIVLYATADIVLQMVSGNEISPTLTTCWFTFFAIEIWQLARITLKKVDTNYTSDFTDQVDNAKEIWNNFDEEDLSDDTIENIDDNESEDDL